MTRTQTYLGYVTILAAIVVCELVARRRRAATFVDAFVAAARTRIGKAVLAGGWLWLGWHVFVRASHG